MILLVAPILFIGAVLYVAYPLLSQTIQSQKENVTEQQQAVQQKEEIVDILKDIDMDFRMGKLSQQDYESLKLDFEQRAVEAFQRLEALEEEDQPEKKKS